MFDRFQQDTDRGLSTWGWPFISILFPADEYVKSHDPDGHSKCLKPNHPTVLPAPHSTVTAAQVCESICVWLYVWAWTSVRQLSLKSKEENMCISTNLSHSCSSDCPVFVGSSESLHTVWCLYEFPPINAAVSVCESWFMLLLS